MLHVEKNSPLDQHRHFANFNHFHDLLHTRTGDDWNILGTRIAMTVAMQKELKNSELWEEWKAGSICHVRHYCTTLSISVATGLNASLLIARCIWLIQQKSATAEDRTKWHKNDTVATYSKTCPWGSVIILGETKFQPRLRFQSETASRRSNQIYDMHYSTAPAVVVWQHCAPPSSSSSSSRTIRKGADDLKEAQGASLCQLAAADGSSLSGAWDGSSICMGIAAKWMRLGAASVLAPIPHLAWSQPSCL